MYLLDYIYVQVTVVLNNMILGFPVTSTPETSCRIRKKMFECVLLVTVIEYYRYGVKHYPIMY